MTDARRDSPDVGANVNALSGRIIGACIEVHRHLGPGLLESAYEECLAHELILAGMSFKRQLALPVEYKGVRLDAGYRIDLAVEGQVIVEIKSVEQLTPIHDAQLITYLRLTGYPLGLLLNFNVRTLVTGVKRRANTIKPSSASSAALR
jgi:GxxExxY protein